MSSLTRRKFFKLGASLAAGGALVTAADAAFFEPDCPRLVEIEIPLARLSPAFDGFRIAQLSDFHYQEHFSAVAIRKAVTMVNTLKVDVIVLTGDFVTVPINANHRTAKAGANAIDPCAHVLSPLRARLGTFACMGNHDTGSDPRRVSRTLEQNGIPVLINRSVPFEQNNSRLWLAGIGDAMEGRDDLSAALRGIPSGEPVILLAHEPDLALQIAKSPVDLQLSGHSHGGQVRLPWIGALVLPELAEIYPWGLNRVGNMMLYTNVGIGTIRVPVRFNCPAEVTLITLRSVPNRRA